MGERGDTDPRRVRSLAVHTADVLDAFEARERAGRPVVLRMLPPFSGRMRARLHVVDDEAGGGAAGAVHFHPGVFVESPPLYPRVDDTADELRERGTYDVATHREHHEQAVETWRETARSRLRDRIEFQDSGWETEATLRVRYLG